MKILIR